MRVWVSGAFALALTNVAAAQVSSPPPPPPATVMINHGPFVAFYDRDTAVIGKDASDELANAVKSANQVRQPATLVVRGHSDSAEGAAGFGDRISRERAEGASARLRQLGLAARHKVRIEALGPTQPKIETAYGASEGYNRRVEVVIDTGS